jgi:hypothetical protein
MSILERKSKNDEPAREPDYSAVAAELRSELATAASKKERAELGLLRARRAEMQRARGVKDAKVEDRIQRAEFERSRLKAAVNLMIEAIADEIAAREKAQAGFARAQASHQARADKLFEERKKLLEQFDEQANCANNSRHALIRENAAVLKSRDELEQYVSAAEAIGNGEKLKLWKEPDQSHPLHRQPSRADSIYYDIDDLRNGVTQSHYDAVENERRRIRETEEREWVEASRAWELGVGVDKLRLLESNDRPGNEAA